MTAPERLGGRHRSQEYRAREHALQGVRDAVEGLKLGHFPLAVKRGIVESGNTAIQTGNLGWVSVASRTYEVRSDGEEGWEHAIDYGVGVLSGLVFDNGRTYLGYTYEDRDFRAPVEHVRGIRQLDELELDRVRRLISSGVKIGKGLARITAEGHETLSGGKWQARGDHGIGVVGGLRTYQGGLHVVYERDGRQFRAPVDKITAVSKEAPNDPTPRDENGDLIDNRWGI